MRQVCQSDTHPGPGTGRLILDDTNPMAFDETHPDGCGRPAGSIGALIRAAADGELTDEQVAAFEKLCAERNCTEDRVRFEQTLRECCGRVMGAPSCSEALRARVQALAEQTRPGAVRGGRAPASGRPGFWAGAPLLTLAATVLLTAAGVFVWQAARLPGPAAPGAAHHEVAYRDRIAGFVADEHARCRTDAAALSLRDLDQARRHFVSAFGTECVGLSDADSLTFRGGGDCRPPGADRAAHFRFDAASAGGEPLAVSLFVMPDNGRLPLEDGTTYRMNARACTESGLTLHAWRAEGLLYLLVSEADACDAARRSLNAPLQTAGF